MKWDDVGDQQCSVARSSNVLGDRWSLLILSDCFLGVRRFDLFQQRLKIPRTTLATRLKKLEEHGVLEQRPYQDKPVRFEYRLTQKGRDLYPVIATLITWGDKYYSDEDGPPILRRHETCGHDFQTVLACDQCGEEIELKDVRARKRPENDQFAPVLRGPVTVERS